MKSTFSFSAVKIKLYAEITECYKTYYYIMDGSKFVIGRQMSATGRICIDESKYCDDTAGIRSDDKGIE